MIAPSSQNARKKTTTGTHSDQVPSAPSATSPTLSIGDVAARARRSRASAARYSTANDSAASEADRAGRGAVAARTGRLGRLDEDRLRRGDRGGRGDDGRRRTTGSLGVTTGAADDGRGVSVERSRVVGGLVVAAVGTRVGSYGAASCDAGSAAGVERLVDRGASTRVVERLVGGGSARRLAHGVAAGRLGIREALVGAADDVIDVAWARRRARRRTTSGHSSDALLTRGMSPQCEVIPRRARPSRRHAVCRVAARERRRPCDTR